MENKEVKSIIHTLRTVLNIYGLVNTIDDRNIDKAIQALQTVDDMRWIPCSEKLPEDNDDILFTQYDEMFEDCHVDKCKGWWFKEHLTNMKAWMLLPKPYKESENNGR